MSDIYLDGAANTPLDPQVYEAMKPYLKEDFVGNANSTHDYGMKASMAIEDSRLKIADIMKVRPSQVIFNSGATEGNNTAIKSLVLHYLATKEGAPHIICGATEHSSVLNACKQMESIGCSVSYIPPDKDGHISEQEIYNKIKENTILICLMSVNNELGTENSVTAVTEFARGHNIYTLIDCTQCVSYGGKDIRLGEKYPSADMMTFSAHKIYGPLGVGALIVTNENAQKIIENFPLLSGGAQEHGARGGTSNVPGIVGMAKAIELMFNNPLGMFYDQLYRHLIRRINEESLPIILNAHPDHRNILSLNISKIDKTESAATDLTMLGVACSSGSACDANHDETAGDFNPSHVLKAIDLSDEDVKGTIRVSFTKYTTLEDIDNFIDILKGLKATGEVYGSD